MKLSALTALAGMKRLFRGLRNSTSKAMMVRSRRSNAHGYAATSHKQQNQD